MIMIAMKKCTINIFVFRNRLKKQNVVSDKRGSSTDESINIFIYLYTQNNSLIDEKKKIK